MWHQELLGNQLLCVCMFYASSFLYVDYWLLFSRISEERSAFIYCAVCRGQIWHVCWAVHTLCENMNKWIHFRPIEHNRRIRKLTQCRKKYRMAINMNTERNGVTELSQVHFCCLRLMKMISSMSELRYLGHIINNRLTDDDDINHEIRNMFTGMNVLLQRFSKCSMSWR